MIEYMQRTRDYYAALGYQPYAWAHHDSVPFTAMAKPLAQSRLALITTAAPYRAGVGDQGPGAAYNAAAKFFEVYTCAMQPTPELRISHLGYDRLHTTAADRNSFLPIKALRDAQAEGRVGSLAPHLIGVPTNRSQRITVERDAANTLARVREYNADVALLVPT